MNIAFVSAHTTLEVKIYNIRKRMEEILILCLEIVCFIS